VKRGKLAEQLSEIEEMTLSGAGSGFRTIFPDPEPDPIWGQNVTDPTGSIWLREGKLAGIACWKKLTLEKERQLGEVSVGGRRNAGPGVE
jgi:hypothetical protein